MRETAFAIPTVNIDGFVAAMAGVEGRWTLLATAALRKLRCIARPLWSRAVLNSKRELQAAVSVGGRADRLRERLNRAEAGVRAEFSTFQVDCELQSGALAFRSDQEAAKWPGASFGCAGGRAAPIVAPRGHPGNTEKSASSRLAVLRLTSRPPNKLRP